VRRYLNQALIPALWKISATKLAKSFVQAGYFERNLRAIFFRDALHRRSCDFRQQML
jgi:hypothetical protein